MVNNYVSPYLNPYAQYPNYQQQMTPQYPQEQVKKVNGENGARAFPLGANSSAWILDENGLISWLIVSDSAGYKTVTPYDITPHQQAKAPDYSTLESRIARLEGLVNEQYTTDSTAIKRKPNSKSSTSSDDAPNS